MASESFRAAQLPNVLRQTVPPGCVLIGDEGPSQQLCLYFLVRQTPLFTQPQVPLSEGAVGSLLLLGHNDGCTGGRGPPVSPTRLRGTVRTQETSWSDAQAWEEASLGCEAKPASVAVPSSSVSGHRQRCRCRNAETSGSGAAVRTGGQPLPTPPLPPPSCAHPPPHRPRARLTFQKGFW